MKHNMGFKKTGKCHICGRSTKLLVHMKCGEIADTLNGKSKKAKKYTKEFEDNLVDGSNSC